MIALIDGVDRSLRVITAIDRDRVHYYDCDKAIMQLACEILAEPNREDRRIEFEVAGEKIVKIERVR